VNLPIFSGVGVGLGLKITTEKGTGRIIKLFPTAGKVQI